MSLPPPLPPVGFLEQKIQSEKANGGGMKNVGVPVFPVETSAEDVPRPKLKPLHYWFYRLNEEMIKTLFGCNVASTKEVGWQLTHSPTREERVLDQKKAQNIAILLRALDVTKEEVSEALLEGDGSLSRVEQCHLLIFRRKCICLSCLSTANCPICAFC